MRGKIDLWERKRRVKCADCGCDIPIGRKRCYGCADIKSGKRHQRTKNKRYHERVAPSDPAS